MKLYNLTEVKGVLLNQLTKEQMDSKETSFVYEAYSMRYAIDKLSIDKVNMIIDEDPRFTFYIDEEQLSKINLIVRLKTGFEFNYSKIKPYDVDDNKVYSHKVTKSDDLKLAVQSFKKIPLIADAIREHEYERQIRKDRNIEIQNKLTYVDPNSVLSKKVVSIDFEFDPNEREFNFKHISELGFSYYNKGLIESEHFIIEENKKNNNKQRLQESFLFGKSKTIKIADIESVIRDVLIKNDIIVFHSYASEMLFLENHNIDVSDKEIYDTQLVFKNYFDDNNPNTKKLSHMLQHFDLPYGFLHNAGNDSYHTMKVFEHMIHKISPPKVYKKRILSVA